MNFWTDDIRSDNIRSPKNILKEAADELRDRAPHLEIELVESEIDGSITLAFEILNTKAKVSLNLFECRYEAGEAYPISIIPPRILLPDYLKEERWVPGTLGLGSISQIHRITQEAIIQDTPGRTVRNEWVCATPEELEDKLTKLFSKADFKSRVIGIIAADLPDISRSIAPEDAAEQESKDSE